MTGFKILKKDPDTRARYGILKTKHFNVTTPNFMPVATQATVKTISPRELENLGVEIIICNTYHLMLRPGSELIGEIGGLHKFMAWNRAILTDSGGFQAYSLSSLRKVNDKGIEFASHIDGSRHLLDPESVIEIQQDLCPDIAMCLDVFTPYPTPFLEARLAVERTVKWAKKSHLVKKKCRYLVLSRVRPIKIYGANVPSVLSN